MGDRDSVNGEDGVQMSTLSPTKNAQYVVLNPQEVSKQRLFRAKAAVGRFVEHWLTTTVMMLATFWALYQSGIKFAATNKDADAAFEIIASIIFFMFLVEMIMQMFYKDDYFVLPVWKALPDETWSETWYRRCQIGSFYFWLDFVATFSLILDLQWIVTPAGYDAINGGGVSSAKAGGASASGARAARVVRVVRMVRLVRLAKVYKYFTNAFENRDKQKRQGANGGEDDELAESRVGAAMADLTNRRVIVLILMMLIIIPLLTPSDPDISQSLAVQVLQALGKSLPLLLVFVYCRCKMST